MTRVTHGGKQSSVSERPAARHSEAVALGGGSRQAAALVSVCLGFFVIQGRHESALATGYLLAVGLTLTIRAGR